MLLCHILVFGLMTSGRGSWIGGMPYSSGKRVNLLASCFCWRKDLFIRFCDQWVWKVDKCLILVIFYIKIYILMRIYEFIHFYIVYEFYLNKSLLFPNLVLIADFSGRRIEDLE